MLRKTLLCVLLASSPCLGQAIYGTKTIAVTEQGVIPIRCKRRYSTVVILPPGRNIWGRALGDSNFWPVQYKGRFLMIKPARSGLESNLQLITTDGHVYSFLLSVAKKGQIPDLKVFVKDKAVHPSPKPAACDTSGVTLMKQLLAQEQTSLDASLVALSKARGEAAAKVDPTTFLARLDRNYKISRKLRSFPFRVMAIYNDGTRTYLKAEAKEAPALYAIEDGKPALIQYQMQDGLFVADEVIRQGYLRVGKKSARFELKD
jgi:type IV secretory pathway VirB9-like protein